MLLHLQELLQYQPLLGIIRVSYTDSESKQTYYDFWITMENDNNAKRN